MIIELQICRYSKSKIGHILLVQNCPSSRPTLSLRNIFLLEQSTVLQLFQLMFIDCEMRLHLVARRLDFSL